MPTVGRVTPSRWATSRLDRPSAHANTIRHRKASDCDDFARLICLVIPLRLGAPVVVYTIAYGLLMTGIGTVILATSVTLLNEHIGTAFGTITMSLGVSQLISPLIGGWLADRTGDFAVTYLVASAAGVTAGLVATLLPVNNRAGRPSRG